MSLSVAAAPVAGRYIAMYFHWQGNFVALLAIGFITLLMTFFFIPHDQPVARQVSMSLRGYLPVLRSQPLMLLIIHIAFICVPYWVFLGMSSMLYIKDLGVSISQYGFYQGTWAFVFALGSILFGFVISKLDPKKLLSASGYIIIISMVLIGYVTYIDSRDPLLITLALIPFSISTIIPVTILYPVCLNLLPEIKGRVSAIVSFSRLVLSALGLEIAGYFYQGSFRNIGVVITCFILVAIITLFMILNNSELMKFSGGVK
jgi:DHA1 family bicyclomycin/chloramphenicol resistance-like MFS transporter